MSKRLLALHKLTPLEHLTAALLPFLVAAGTADNLGPSNQGLRPGSKRKSPGLEEGEIASFPPQV
jgi:hypothetical protein